MRSRAVAASVWLLCAAAASVYALAFYPGWLSFDSSYQWWQARSGEISNINGIGIVLLWRVTLLLQDGPAPMLLLQLMLFWTGVAWIALALPARPVFRLSLIAVLALAPASWLLAQIWSDTALLALLVLATGAILRYRATGSRVFVAMAVFALALAMSQRHNAMFAVVPLLLWLCGADGAMRWRRIAIAASLTAVLLVGVQLTTRLLTRQWFPVLPSLTLWDLSGMSVHENRMLLPDYAVAPQSSVADLASAYVPWSNTPLFASPRAGVRYPFQPWPEEEQRRLTHDWLTTVARHPSAYLAHRGALLADLFGTRARELPAELTFVPGPVQYRDNPVVAMHDSAPRRLARHALDRLRDTVAFAAWPYLLIGAVAALHALRRRDSRSAPALWLCASAWAYALPYAVLAPAAEFRYLLWSCIASLIAAWIRICGHASDTRAAADAGTH
ncbi:hypothetical protein [Tahibacter sp.]|uniref:hypothetical protein n=1 Tax=Tahibacter sp. TaxID=2056211 RepID=UPI0028C3B8AD|nr:hypothetical protein [Tahibacter sp.]